MRTDDFFTVMRSSIGKISLLACLPLAVACGQSDDDEGATGGAGGVDATGGIGSDSGGSAASGGSEASGGTPSTGGNEPGTGGASTGGAASTGGNDGGASTTCDTRKLTCKRATPPACPVGDVHAIVSGCYGECVPIESCSCASQDECPDPQGNDEFACHMSSGHCGYLVR